MGTMSMTRWQLAGLFGALMMAAPWDAALASGGGGGGGGGGMPSASAPEYDPAAEYQSGMAAYQAGKFKDAARAFDHVTEAAPREARGWFMLGMAKSSAGDDKSASRAFERSLKVDASAIDAGREYALSLIRLKTPDKATAELAALKARAAACADACAEAADLKTAIAAIEQAMSASKPSAALAAPGEMIFAPAGDAAYVRAVSLINQRRYAEALVALDKAQAAFGPHPDVLTYQGYVWRKLGRMDQAELYYQAALAIAPAHRGATEYYGELKVIEGDLAGAKILLSRLDDQCIYGCVEAEELRRWIAHGRDPAS